MSLAAKGDIEAHLRNGQKEFVHEDQQYYCQQFRFELFRDIVLGLFEMNEAKQLLKGVWFEHERERLTNFFLIFEHCA